MLRGNAPSGKLLKFIGRQQSVNGVFYNINLSNMRRVIIGVLLIFNGFSSHSQTKYNLALKKELDSIYILDQRFRALLSSELLQSKADSIAASFNIPKDKLINYIIALIPSIDSANLIRIDQIIKQYGYPGKSLVGDKTNEAAFYVIQHSDSIDKYLPLIKAAADQKELSFTLYAMMLDRSLMYNGKEQVYGSQGKGFEILNPETNKKEFKRIIWPIKDPEHVNRRRAEAGFKDTVEENAKRLGIEYKVLTLDDLKKMQLHRN